MKLVAVLSALLVIVVARPGGGGKGFSGLSFSGTCVVTGNTLYANGFEVRTLTSSEQNEVSQYEQQMADFKQQSKAMRKELEPIMRKQFFGQQLNSTEQQLLDQAQNLTSPDAPSFCSGNDTVMYILDGCIVQNNKVYVGSTYARDLTSDEQSQLENYYSQVQAYTDYMQQNMKQQIQSIFSDVGSRLMGPPSDLAPSTTTQSSDQSNAPEMPEQPQLCYTFY